VAHNDEAEDAAMQEVISFAFTSAQISDFGETIDPLLLSAAPTNAVPASESIPTPPEKELSSPTLPITETPPPKERIQSPPIKETPPPKQTPPITKPQLQPQQRPLATAKPRTKSTSTPRIPPPDKPSTQGEHSNMEIPPSAPGADDDSYQVEEVEDELLSDHEGDGDDTGSTTSH
jgi:outer membrane biosynthesis protein TonB